MVKAKWLIHLKDGKTLTSKDCYPHEAPQKDITSVERITTCRDGRTQVAVIAKAGKKKPKILTNFFVKSEASKSMDLFGRKSAPSVVNHRIIGCFLPPQEMPVRLELGTNTRTGAVVLRVFPVKKITKDGF